MSNCNENNCSSLKELITNYKYNNLLPIHGILSVTNRCNLNCSYCFHKQNEIDINFYTADMAIKYIISNATIQKVKPNISFFGGEPLLLFDEIIKPLINKYKDSINWTITTNGTLLTENIIDFFTDNNVSILLSMDGCKKVQDNQRPMKNGESCFDKLKNIIPYLLLKQPNTIFRSTISRYSLDFLEENINTAKNFGFKYITLVPNLFEEWQPEDFYKWEQFIDNESIKIMQKISWEEPFDYILTNLKDGIQGIYKSNQNNYLKNPIDACGMGFKGIGISPNGKLHPCQEENGVDDINIIGDIYYGIDKKLHEQYCKDIYNKWLEYIEKIDNIIGSSNFKLFYGNHVCNTRLKDGFAFNNTQTYYLRALHRACSRLYYNFNLSLNPRAQYFLGEIE
ncbi:MAG: radical SAM protein [Firmicutes bacterium]|nr:radical SAM protein [Bacillota bacterium]